MGFSRLLLFLTGRRARLPSSSSMCRSISMVNEFVSHTTAVAVEPCRYRFNISYALFSTTSSEAIQSVMNQIEDLYTHDTENHPEVEKEKEKEKEATSCSKTEEGGGGISSEHPWPEWSALMEVLVRNGYFKTFADDDGGDDDGRSMLKDFNHVRNACLNFGRDRFDILRSLSKEDIQKIVQYGCPSIDRKVVNSGKRLRSYMNIEEGDVCRKCNVRGSCDRAYISAPKEESARTVDVIRILLTYGLDPIFDSVENKLHTKKTVKSSICKLLREVVELSATPLDPNLPLPISHPTIKRALAPPIKQSARTDIEMKKGDWLCPRCNIINFSKNMLCIQCDEMRPKVFPGEWECPDCNFINFSRNMKCLKCDCKRPKNEEMAIANELNPGDWKCPKCNFLNFRRNTTCLECDCMCPKDDNVDIRCQNAGDWKCPECRFINFGKNRRCLKCECKCPNDNTKIARQLNSGDWKCPECGFMNFGRNRGCLKCECKGPNDNIARQLHPGDWKCPECRYPNFGRNIACLKCQCKRPMNVHSEIARQRGNDSWADDISGLQDLKHVNQRSSGRDRSSSSGSTANDFSDLDLDDLDDDCGEYKQKRAGSGRSSDRNDGSSTSPRGQEKFYNYDETDDEDDWFGGHHRKELGSSQRFSSAKPKSATKSFENFGDLDSSDDDDVGYGMKKANSKQSSGRAYNSFASSAIAKEKGTTHNYDNTDDEDDWFGENRGKRLGLPKTSFASKPKSMKNTFGTIGDFNDRDDNNDLFDSEDEQPQMSQTKKIGEARAFRSGNHKTQNIIGRQPGSTSRNRKVGN